MKLRDFFSIVELRTKIVSMSTLTLATLWTLVHRGSIDWIALSLLIPAGLLVDMGTTAFNSFFDYLSGVDNKQYNRENDKVLVHEDVPAGRALVVALGCFGLAMLLGLALAWRVGFWVLPAGAVAMLIGFLYTGGPLPISRTPLGELFAGGTLGTVFFIIVSTSLSPNLDGAALFASIPLSLAIAAILAVNNACDRLGDQAAGRKTLAILLGPRMASMLPGLLMIVAWGLGLWQVLGLPNNTVPSLALALLWGLGFLACCLSWLPLVRYGFSQARKGPSMGIVSRSFLVFVATQALVFLVVLLAT